MKINVIQTCVDYGDFLAWTLPANKRHFNYLVVLTSPHDKQTQLICAHNHVRCIPTTAWWDNGDSFNKARGISKGISLMADQGDAWLLHLDADIWLPPRTGEILAKLNLDPTCIYGIDRMECKTFNDWINFHCAPSLQHEQEIFVKMDAFPVGVRIARLAVDGYVPIGFFQLWHPGVSGIQYYPEEHTTAARSDMLFAMQWPRSKRLLIPEIVGIHLESEKTEMGQNWQGRITKQFKPEA